MGSWYETCGLSGLPILWKEKALVVLLGPGSSLDDGRGGFCYPSGLWAPLCPPFFGTYNDDHGTLDFAKKAPAHWKYTKDILDDLKLTWRDAREKDWQKLPVTYDYEKFFEPIERGYVRGKSHERERFPKGIIPIGQMLVRQDVWDYFLASNFETWYGETSREAAHEDARAFVKYVVENPPSKNPLKWAFEVEDHFDKVSGGSVLFWTIFRSAESGPNFAHYRIMLMHALADKAVTPEEALAVLYEIADVAHVNRMMSHLRRAWQPQTGKGSQDINWGLHADFLKKFAEIANQKAKQEEDDA